MRSGFLLLHLCASLLLSAPAAAAGGDPASVSDAYFQNSRGQRTFTDAVIFNALASEYPDLDITIVPLGNCNIFDYAAAGFANTSTLVADSQLATHKWSVYYTPYKLDGGEGGVGEEVKFGVYSYVWEGTEFIVYLVDGRDGGQPYPDILNQYIIGPRAVAEKLIIAAGKYASILHDEVWVFDQGMWTKDRSLFISIQKSSWDNVILDKDMKDAVIDTAQRFFDSKDQYNRLEVPWKRGVIFHGPPGNGKTISIKATMKMLYDRADPVATLYVKTLSNYGVWALKPIFDKAREEAPCYLVFEDLDSLVTDEVRSYFLNQVDGVQANDGILMVGSTNHLELLDPGISKRPSRFDRKFYFPDPDYAQRVQYCLYWRKKLSSNKEIVFPKAMADAVANITQDFSFAYIQEAFVASLLKIANEPNIVGILDAAEEHIAEELLVEKSVAQELEHVLLWRLVREQVGILRRQLEDGYVFAGMEPAERVMRAASGDSEPARPFELFPKLVRPPLCARMF